MPLPYARANAPTHCCSSSTRRRLGTRERYAKHDVSVGYSAAMMLGSYAVHDGGAQRMGAVFETSFDAITALRFGRYDAAYAAEGERICRHRACVDLRLCA